VDVLVKGAFELAEGARQVDGRLLFVDLLKGRLYSWHEGVLEPLVVSAAPLGVAAPVRGRPDALALAEGMSATVTVKRGAGTGRALQIPLDDDADTVAMRVNDGCCDPFGRFWIGTMPARGQAPPGSVYIVDSLEGVTCVLRDIACPNGPAFSRDHRVYLADTISQVILRATLDRDSGACTPFEEFSTVPGGLPDGMTVDDEGSLWVAVWGAGEVRRIAPDGRLQETLRCGAVQPTSVCLMPVGGRPAVVVTTARTGLMSAGSLDGAILAFETDATAPAAAAWDPGDLLALPAQAGSAS
jgi:sugar lactone lactonase YvrE